MVFLIWARIERDHCSRAGRRGSETMAGPTPCRQRRSLSDHAADVAKRLRPCAAAACCCQFSDGTPW